MKRNLGIWAFAIAAAGLAACGGQKSPEASRATDEQKGKFGVYYYVTVSRPAGGAIRSGDGKIDCGTAGGVTATVCGPARYEWPQIATLSAYADASSATDPFYFQSWAGDCSSDVADRGCILDTSSFGADKWVMAVFNNASRLGHGNIASPSAHAKKFFAFLGNDAGAPRCNTCHGQSYNGQGIAPSCNACHAAAGWANWQESCSFCHGEKSPRSKANYDFGLHPEWAAPPDDVNGRLTGSNGNAVGAHQAHVAVNEFRSPIGCSECHLVPATAIHTLNHSLDLPFGPLSKSQGAVPLWDAGTLTCSANYCHGNFQYGLVQGKAASLTWMGTLTGCTTCHDMPPTGHAASADPRPASCSICHGGTVNGDGTINIAGGLHINGKKDGGGGHAEGFSDPLVHGPLYLDYKAGRQGALDCTECHGTTLASCNACHTSRGFPNWQTNCNFCHAYPPTTGAHAAHFGLAVTNPTNGYGDLGTLETRSPANADPVAAGTKYAFGCGNCHPTDGSKHMNGTVDAALARPASATGSLKDLNASTASYNADPSSPRTCSGVYCHSTGQATPEFAVTPAWDSGTKLGCAGCHENPPKYASGGAGTATANTHVVAGDDGYAVGHFGGFHGPWGNSYHGYTMGAGGYDSAPITCQTCHFDTTDPTNTGPSGFYYLDTSGNYSVIDPSNGLPSIIYDPITDTGALNNDACKNCHTAGSGVAPQGNGRVLPLRHVNGQRDVVFDARSSAGSLVGYPGAPSEPNLKPYWWSNIGAPGRLPLGAVWENGTWSSDLRSAGYNPSTKTCSNVACHIDQGTPTGPPLVWGTLPVGWASCDACHGYARP